MLHLESAIEQVDNAMEYSNGKGQGLSKKEDSIQPSTFGAYLRPLEKNAVEEGEAGLVASLARPFHRLLKYHLLFQNPLFYIDLITPEFGAGPKIVREIESIVGAIEDERIQKIKCHKVWDVLRRIDGLDTVKKFAVPKPSRILLEEYRTPVGSRCSPKRLSEVLWPGSSNKIGGERDLWLVVFNDVVLRCQRTGTVSVTGWGAPRTTRLKLKNLYKFLKACLIARVTVCYPY
jgi:hypothetical protein